MSTLIARKSPSDQNENSRAHGRIGSCRCFLRVFGRASGGKPRSARVNENYKAGFKFLPLGQALGFFANSVFIALVKHTLNDPILTFAIAWLGS